MMRKVLLFLFLIAAIGSAAQSGVRIEGRIVSENGKAVEYATIGIQGKGIGTLSDADGTFALNIDDECRDTLVISHISYYEVRIPANELLSIDAASRADTSAVCTYQAGDVVMKIREQELGEIIVNSGGSRKIKFAGRGMKMPGGATMLTVANKGCEVGSMVEAKKVFELQEISFSVRSNAIPGARFSVNIYKENDATGEFCNTLCRPVYFSIPVCAKKQEVKVDVGDDVVIAPGRYFVSIMFVDHDNIEGENGESANCIYFPLYLKSSYRRNGVMGSLEPIPMNMGLCLKGVEYR